ncbi:MAG: CRTAC1 family protein [Planctomycetia bacterium]|nr:CRTAC1 family protein [Planctomycetia bacterium]
MSERPDESGRPPAGARRTSGDAREEDGDGDDAVIGRALVRSLVVLGCLAAAACGIALWRFWPRPQPIPVESQLTLPSRRARPEVVVPRLPFTDMTAPAGITFVHENGAAGEKLLPETMGGGCACFDFDGDGDQDILFTSGCRWPWDERPVERPATQALYRNDGDWTFTDVTAGSGLDITCYATGVAVGDFDADGRTDVFLSAVGPDRLLRNLGDGRFADVTAAAGVAGDEGDWGTSCCFLDADGDGDLDLFVCHYVVWSRALDRAQDFRLVGGGRAYGRPQNFAGTFPRLWRNDGAGRFTDVSAEAGVQVRNPATDVPAAKSLGVACDDLDGDGLIDIVVANDTVQNFLFHNLGAGRFAELAGPVGVAYDTEGRARGAMGIDIARFRNDDEVGILIGNFANEMSALYVSTGRQLQFRDDAVSNGLGPETRQELTFGVLFADVDLDGRLDILQTNGHLEEDINKVQRTQFYEQSPELFWNCGVDQPTEFVAVALASVGEGFHRPLVGRGAARADLDGDGDPDFVLTSSGGAPRLLRNDQATGHHWVRIRLVGPAANPEAIGALVELVSPADHGTQRRCVGPARSYQSQSELPVTFGLGTAAGPVTIRVRWPDGTFSTHADLPVDGVHTLRHDAAATVPPAA